MSSMERNHGDFIGIVRFRSGTPGAKFLDIYSDDNIVLVRTELLERLALRRRHGYSIEQEELGLGALNKALERHKRKHRL